MGQICEKLTKEEENQKKKPIILADLKIDIFKKPMCNLL
jgi:hypothetical protein